MRTTMTDTRACGKCAAENPTDASFCMACGAALERSCPGCGAPAPAEARFCGACGTVIEAESEPPATARAPGGAPGAGVGGDTEPRVSGDVRGARGSGGASEERRTVTVLFADLSGYTAVAERLDPETVKALVDRCLGRLGEEVEGVGGHVDKYMGDAVMAIFGAPVAHEDDPERAVRAALGMQRAMDELNRRLLTDHGFEFALCVGVNTGEVLAGKVGDAYTVIGDAVNVASRLQTSASPGTVTVGERTQRATSVTVEYEPLAPLELKGKAEPVAAWRAIRMLEERTGGARQLRRETPLIGREDELASLQMLFSRVARAELRIWSPCSAKPASARRGCYASSSAGLPPASRPCACARAVVCRLARASCTGHSAKCCAPSARSSTTIPPRWPGRSSRRGSRRCWPTTAAVIRRGGASCCLRGCSGSRRRRRSGCRGAMTSMTRRAFVRACSARCVPAWRRSRGRTAGARMGGHPLGG